MKVSRLVACAGMSLMIPVTLVAGPAIAVHLTVQTAKAKSTAPQGPSLVHIEAPKATVSQVNAATHGATLTLDTPDKVRWLGEAKNSNGLEVLTYGEQPASQLPGDWKPLGHTQNLGAMATLTWNTHSAAPHFALVKMETPRYSSHKHVMQAHITTQDAIPAHISDVSLNLHRADSKSNRGFPTTSNFNFSATTIAQTVQVNTATVQESILSGPIYCYQAGLIQQAPVVTLPNGLTCGNGTTFVNGKFSMNVPTPNYTGQVIFNGTLISNGGQPMQFYGIVATLQYS